MRYLVAEVNKPSDALRVTESRPGAAWDRYLWPGLRQGFWHGGVARQVATPTQPGHGVARTIPRRYRLAPMIRRRLLGLLAGVGLCFSSLTVPAWAHPGHDLASGPQAGDNREAQGVGGSSGAAGQHAPSPLALAAGALALFAALPQRRRTLALALVLFLTVVSLEGLAHAALHLQKIRHADSLAIGASTSRQVAAHPDAALRSATPEVRWIEVAALYEAPPPDIVIAPHHGRSPPLSPA